MSLRLQEIVNLFPGWKSKSFGGLELGMSSKNGGEMEFPVVYAPCPYKRKIENTMSTFLQSLFVNYN